jgi:TonB family protein
MWWLFCPVLALACLWPGPSADRQDEDFQLLRDWMAVGDGARTEAAKDTLLLESGTIETRAVYANFVFRFEYRLPQAESAGLLYVRARFDDGRVRGYGVALDGSFARGQLSAEGQLLHEGRAAGPSGTIPPSQWVACEVRAEGRRLTVTFDGLVVSQADRLEGVDGHLAFKAVRRGGVELRGMRIATLAASPPQPEPEPDPFPTDLLKADSPGVKRPKATYRALPAYPLSALEARVGGKVGLEIVVDATGRLTHARVTSAPHPDLGAAAIECAKKWRFKPATKDGMPIAVVATMDIEFKLKK